MKDEKGGYKLGRFYVGEPKPSSPGWRVRRATLYTTKQVIRGRHRMPIREFYGDGEKEILTAVYEWVSKLREAGVIANEAFNEVEEALVQVFDEMEDEDVV